LAFTAELAEAGIAGSIGTVGDALDNALCESTIALFETEAVNLTGPAWPDRRDVEWQVARWIHWYNTTRLHSSIGHLPPIEYEQLQRRPRPRPPTGRSRKPRTPRGFQDGSSWLGARRPTSPTRYPECDP
jgi:transposase InsO family protein